MRYFAFGVVDNPVMANVALCRKMQWTYTELMDQPQWFIQHMTSLLIQESKSVDKKSKKSHG